MMKHALACLLVFLGTTTGLTSDATERPNVVLIMTDDQGYGDFGATGNRVIRTPNLDRFATQSAWMTQFYVSPVCSPTRASLMTGRYNYRTRVIDTWLGRSMMEPDEVTIAELLRKNGYATGIFGKWHLGDCYPMRPGDQGFEESLVHRGGGLAQPSEPRENHRRYTDPILFRNGVKEQTKGYCTDVYFREAIKFIESCQRDKRNFFVFIPSNAPHGPFHDVPEDLRRQYMENPQALRSLMTFPPRNEASGIDRLTRIAAMITNIDDNVGRLTQQLDQLGLFENTIVIFLTDNGPNSARYVGDFRGMKSHVHEGGIRTPFWVRWPARIPAGRTCDKIAAHIDVFPTIAEACGVDVGDNPPLDGKSLLPLLCSNGDDAQRHWPDRLIAIQSHRGDRPQRYHHFMIRDQQWKLLHASGFGRERFNGEPAFELYNIANDPGETTNLVSTNRDHFLRLKKAYDQWFDDVSSTRPDNYAPPRIQIVDDVTETTLTRQDWRNGTWSKNANGYWELHIDTNRPANIEVLVDPTEQQEHVELTIGDLRLHGELAPGRDAYVFRNVMLPPGDRQLQVTLSSDSSDSQSRRGPYQVIVRLQNR